MTIRAQEEFTDRELEALLSGRAQMPVPPEVEEALRSQLDAFRRKLSESRHAKKRGLVGALAEFVAKPYLRPALALATVLAVVVVAVLVTRVSTHDAYANVARQLRTSASISYTIELAEGAYVDIAYMEPGLYRLATSWGMEIVEDRAAGRRTLLIHFLKRYRVESLADRQEQLDDFLNAVRSLPEEADRQAGERMLDGRVAVGYSVDVQGQEMIFWIDRETEKPLQVDIVFKEDNAPVHAMHIRDIRTDEALDPSLFEIEIPEDYTEIESGEGEASIRYPGPGD